MSYILWMASAWSIFLHCVFSNVPSSCLPERMHNHTGCICLTFLHCGFSNDPLMHMDQSMHSHTGCICLSFLHCGLSYVSSNRLCPLSLSLKPDWLCFYYNLLVRYFDPFPTFKKRIVFCNSCFQLKAHWFWIVGTEIESESQNRFSRPRKFGPPKNQ